MLVERLVCKTNVTWVQFPSCSHNIRKVSIIGNAAVLKTAVRITAFAGSSPAPSAIARRSRRQAEKAGEIKYKESRQILVCCGILLRCFSITMG